MYFQQNYQLLSKKVSWASKLLEIDDSSPDVSLYVSEDPMVDAQHWLSLLNLGNDKVLCVYGLGLGHYYEVLDEWLHSGVDRYLVFVEDDLRVIRRFIQTQKATTILNDSQVQLIYLDDVQCRAYDIVRYFIFEKILVAGSLSYAKYKSSTLTFFQNRVSNTVVQYNSFYNEVRGRINDIECDSSLVNVYSNIFYRKFMGYRLFKKFQNIPAIICGAGPSLTKNIDLLQKMSNRALLLAGGTAINSLNNKGILSDLVAYMDPYPAQYDRCFSFNTSFEIPAVISPHTNWQVCDNMHAPMLYFKSDSGYPVIGWLEEQLGLEKNYQVVEGLGVLTWLVDLACLFGCNPIVLVGADLSFLEGALFADGSISRMRIRRAIFNTKRRGVYSRKDIYGNEVYTTDMWINESIYIGQLAEKYPSSTFVNATEGGIGFPGVDNMSLQEVLDRFLQHDNDFMNMTHLAVQSLPFYSVQYQQRDKILGDLRESLLRMERLCDRLIETVDIIVESLQHKKPIPKDVRVADIENLKKDLTREMAYEPTMSVVMGMYDNFMGLKVQEIGRNINLDPMQRNIEVLKSYSRRAAFIKENIFYNVDSIKKVRL